MRGGEKSTTTTSVVVLGSIEEHPSEDENMMRTQKKGKHSHEVEAGGAGHNTSISTDSLLL